MPVRHGLDPAQACTIENEQLGQSPQPAPSVGLPNGLRRASSSMPQARADDSNGLVAHPSVQHSRDTGEKIVMQLELEDGTTYQGFSFGASKSIAGELVFQTGMVGYPEAVTDPSYRGQILVITFPLVGNYGVPSRTTMDRMLNGVPAHFEASQIHVSGLVVASYSGEDYSHYLASSSLGSWLCEQGVPAIYGVDTRALTKRIRESGSMLGKLAIQARSPSSVTINGGCPHNLEGNIPTFEHVDWFNPNSKNLVADGERALHVDPPLG